MKTTAEVASHPKACLHRELVAFLRSKGTSALCIVAWREIRLRPGLWARVVQFGLDDAEHKAQMNRVAFPEHNHADVEAALAAGNKLRAVYELACGQAWAARDDDGHYKPGRMGIKLFRR